MKRYTNIPLKERKRNADRVYRHEERLEKLWWDRENRKLMEEKKKQFMQECEGSESDKERQWNEACERLKALAERREG